MPKDKKKVKGFGSPKARKDFVRGFKNPQTNPFKTLKEFFSPEAKAAGSKKKKKSY